VGNGCKAAYEALDLFDGSGTAHFDNYLALFGIGFYTALGNINPRNLPRSTSNTHLSGLKRRLYWRNAEKTAERFWALVVGRLLQRS